MVYFRQMKSQGDKTEEEKMQKGNKDTNKANGGKWIHSHNHNS